MKSIRKIFGQGNIYQILFLILLFILVTNGFNYVKWPLSGKTIHNVLSLLLLIIVPVFCQITDRQHFRFHILTLAFLPFFSVLYSYSEYGQPIWDGIKATFSSLLLLFYFVLHRYKIKEGSIMQAILYIALFIAAMQVIQQFTYPHVLFGVHLDEQLKAGEEITSTRNGLWRFRFGTVGYFTAFTMFTIWVKTNKKLMGWTLVLFGLMLVSIYLTLTRQVMFSAVLVLFLSYFMGREKINIWALIIGMLIIGVSYVYSEELFDEFVKSTQEDVNNKYIRFAAGQYFLQETFSSVKAMLLGHGVPFSGEFLRLNENLKNVNHFFVTDVGFIGMMWRFGIPYVLVCYSLLYKVFWSFREAVPSYIRFFVLFTTIMSVMIFPIVHSFQYILWCLVLYMSDHYINEKPKKILLATILKKIMMSKHLTRRQQLNLMVKALKK